MFIKEHRPSSHEEEDNEVSVKIEKSEGMQLRSRDKKSYYITTDSDDSLKC